MGYVIYWICFFNSLFLNRYLTTIFIKMLTRIIMTNNTVYFERQLDVSVFTAYQYHFLLFFFLLQAAHSVAVSRSASLSKSASSSICSFSLQAGFSGSPFGITIHSYGSLPGSGHAFTSCSAFKSGSTSTSPSPGNGENTLSLSTRSRLKSKLDNSASANRRVSGVPDLLPSLLLARGDQSPGASPSLSCSQFEALPQSCGSSPFRPGCCCYSCNNCLLCCCSWCRCDSCR
jgi:hypothetical protein